MTDLEQYKGMLERCGDTFIQTQIAPDGYIYDCDGCRP